MLSTHLTKKIIGLCRTIRLVPYAPTLTCDCILTEPFCIFFGKISPYLDIICPPGIDALYLTICLIPIYTFSRIETAVFGYYSSPKIALVIIVIYTFPNNCTKNSSAIGVVRSDCLIILYRIGRCSRQCLLGNYIFFKFFRIGNKEYLTQID